MSADRPTLSPAMMLFEIAAICSRHGIPVSTDNPSAALYHVERTMRALGLVVPADPPEAIAATPATPEPTTAVMPVVPADEPRTGWNLGLPPRRPIDGATFTRGQHRPGAQRSLQVVADDGA